MSLDSVKNLADSNSQDDPIRYYCQGCSVELTNRGSFLANNGSIYCGDVCFVSEVIRSGQVMFANYVPHEKTQRQIRNGKIVSFARK